MEPIRQVERLAAADTLERKRLAFKKLAEKRTNAILEKVRILGNLANRSAYDYTGEDIRKVFGAIRAELRRVEAAFETTERREFRLD